MQHLPSSPYELINEGTAAWEQIWLCGTGSSQGCLWPVTSYMTSCGLSEGGKLRAVVSFLYSGGATVFPAWYPHHVLHKWPTFLLLLIAAQIWREKHFFQELQHPNQLVYSAERPNMHIWSPPSIFWGKEPALGSPRNQMKIIQGWDFHRGCAWSWRKVVPCSQQYWCPPDVCPSKRGPEASHHLCFFCIISALCFGGQFGVVWVCLQVFSCPWWSFVILEGGLESVWEGWTLTVQFLG